MEHLQQHIAQLSRMVEALLSANEALRKENDLLKKQIAAADEKNSLSERKTADANNIYSVPKIQNVSETVQSSVPNILKGINDNSSSIPNIENTSATFQSSVPIFRNGINDDSSSVPSIENASENVHSSVPDFQNGRMNIPPLLPNYQLSAQNVSGLATVLRQHESTGVVSASGTYLRFAKIILQAHNGGNSSHKALRALTGLSDGGIAKTIISMKKRGLIARQKGRIFIPTEYSKQLMQKAGLK